MPVVVPDLVVVDGEIVRVVVRVESVPVARTQHVRVPSKTPRHNT